MIYRDISIELQELMQSFSIVTIFGPRQSGKTTLAKTTFPKYNYCNLEHPEMRELAEKDPVSFLRQYTFPVIIDEIQRAPTLLSYIQVQVDEVQQKGMYLLTGSHQLELSASVSQSLAGRTALLTLLPLSLKELLNHGIEAETNDFIFNGFLPAIYKDRTKPSTLYRNYLNTYIEKDVRQLLNVKNQMIFQKFIRLLAGRVGQILNLSSLSTDIGVSSKTLAEWLSVLEASFVVFTLQPYFENFGKRIIKSPKVYFCDVGLLCYLLNIEKKEQLFRDPLYGSIFENMVVLEAFKTRYNQGKDANLYYFRDNNKQEVDLVYKQANNLIPIEIKSAMTYHNNFEKGIRFFRKLTNGKIQGKIIYSGDLKFENEEVSLLNFRETHTIFE